MCESKTCDKQSFLQLRSARGGFILAHQRFGSLSVYKTKKQKRSPNRKRTNDNLWLKLVIMVNNDR
jgi:hypothetical protein